MRPAVAVQAGNLTLTPTSVLLPPPIESLHCGLPSPEWPSDHISLLASFTIAGVTASRERPTRDEYAAAATLPPPPPGGGAGLLTACLDMRMVYDIRSMLCANPVQLWHVKCDTVLMRWV